MPATVAKLHISSTYIT